MGPPNSQREVQEVREQDRFLPIANISRIMKKSLPPNAKIAKDAKETVQECVSEFISFVTSEASEKCQKEKRKTINGKCRIFFSLEQQQKGLHCTVFVVVCRRCCSLD